MKSALIAVSAIFACLFFFSMSIIEKIPSPEKIKSCLVTTMYKVELCPTSKSYTSLKQISPYLQKTILLTEDSNFYNHHGFEWDVIEKNFREGWETGVYKRGGSTITQQLAKNMFLNKDRTFYRKALEAIITDRIEKTLSKKEIYERYLNVVEFGKNIYGIKEASNFYFHKAPADLDVVESAFLAMILPNPVKYSASYFKKELTPFARKRLATIVDNMFQYHRIDQVEYEVAVSKLSHFLGPSIPATSTIDESGETDSSDIDSAIEEINTDEDSIL